MIGNLVAYVLIKDSVSFLEVTLTTLTLIECTRKDSFNIPLVFNFTAL